MVRGSQLAVRNNERDALADLTVLLCLAHQGKVHGSDKTPLGGTPTVHLFSAETIKNRNLMRSSVP